MLGWHGQNASDPVIFFSLEVKVTQVKICALQITYTFETQEAIIPFLSALPWLPHHPRLYCLSFYLSGMRGNKICL